MNKFCFGEKEKEKILLKQRALPGRKFSSGTVDFGLKDNCRHKAPTKAEDKETRGSRAGHRGRQRKRLPPSFLPDPHPTLIPHLCYVYNIALS